MRLCYLVEITNCLDSSVITRLVTVDSEDKDAVNNIEALIDLYVELDEFDCQAISKIYRVEPINISIE